MYPGSRIHALKPCCLDIRYPFFHFAIALLARRVSAIMSMAGSILLAAGSLMVSTFINYSPYTMATTTPAGVDPWADSPIPLVATPQFETGKV